MTIKLRFFPQDAFHKLEKPPRKGAKETSSNSKGKNADLVNCFEAWLDEETATLQKLVLNPQNDATIVSQTGIAKKQFGSMAGASSFLEALNKPRFYFGKHAETLPSTCENVQKLQKKGASSVRFSFLFTPLDSKQNLIRATITYTFNWLYQLIISYQFSTLQDCPLMFSHPISLIIDEEKWGLLTLSKKMENKRVGWVGTKDNAFKRFFLLNDTNDQNIRVSPKLTLPLCLPSRQLSVQVSSSATALEYGVLDNSDKKPLGNKKPLGKKKTNMGLIYINSFNGYTDNVLGKAVGTSSARSNFSFPPLSTIPYQPYGAYCPYTLKRGEPFFYCTVFNFK